MRTRLPSRRTLPSEHGRDVQRLADLANVVRLPAIRQHRGARNHFQRADLGEIRQDVVLDAVREIRVRLVVAEIREREHRDRFLHFPR